MNMVFKKYIQKKNFKQKGKVMKDKLESIKNINNKEIPLYLGLATAVIGFLGFLLNGSNLIEAFYKTYKLFGGEYDFKNGNFLLNFAAFLVPITIVSTIAIFFQRKLKELWFFLVTSKKGNHIVIFGLGDMGEAFAKNLLEVEEVGEKYSKVVIVEKNEQNSNIEKLLNKGALVLTNDAKSSYILDRIKIYNAKMIFFFTGSDMVNLEILAKIVGKNDINKEKTTFYIHLERRENYELLGSMQLKDINIKSFSIYENIAQTFFAKYPLAKNIDTMDESKQLHFAIVGYEAIGEELLYRALNLGHFYNAKPLHITIFDEDPNANKRIFLKTFPIDLETDYWKIEFKEECELYKNDGSKEFNQILFCKNDAQTSFTDALRLKKNQANIIADKEIYIFVDTHNAITSLLENENKNDKNDKNFILKPFGDFHEVCSYDVVVNEVLDKMAKKTNGLYNKLHGYNKDNKTEEEQWSKLTPFLKDSNRMQVEHLRIKLQVINKILETKNSNEKNKEKSYEEIKEEARNKWFNKFEDKMLWDEIEGAETLAMYLTLDQLEKLAKTEKNRWNAFHILNGWKKKEIPKGKQEKIEKNKKTKEHPCLVSWDDLDKISENHKHNYKGDDVETIMRAYHMINSINDEEWLNEDENKEFKKFVDFIEKLKPKASHCI